MQQYQELLNMKLCMDAPTLIQGHLCDDNRKYTHGYLSPKVSHREVSRTKSDDQGYSNNQPLTDFQNHSPVHQIPRNVSENVKILHRTHNNTRSPLNSPINGIKSGRFISHTCSLSEIEPFKNKSDSFECQSRLINSASSANSYLNRVTNTSSKPTTPTKNWHTNGHATVQKSYSGPQYNMALQKVMEKIGHHVTPLPKHLENMDTRSLDALERTSSAGQSSPDHCTSDSSLENSDDYGFLPRFSNSLLPATTMDKMPSAMPSKSPLLSNKSFTKKWRKFKSTSTIKTGDCLWTPCLKGSCVWSSVRGQRVQLTRTYLFHLTEAERIILRKISLNQLQDMDLGCAINLPKDGSHKRSRRSAFLLKRRSTGSGIWDQLKDKKQVQNYAFGIPLSKCVSNDVDLQRNCRPMTKRDRKQSMDIHPPTTPQHVRKSSSSSVSVRHGARLLSLPRHSIGHTGVAALEILRSIELSAAGAISSDSISESDISPGSDLLDALSLSSSAQLELSEQRQQTQRASLRPHTLQIPYVMRACCQHLEKHGLNTLGIFRIGCSKKRTKQLREEFDSGQDMNLTEEHNTHDVAALLKEFFRDLPDPLLTKDLYTAFVATRKIDEEHKRLNSIKLLVRLLPAPNRDTLWALLKFLHNVQKHANDSIDAKTGANIPGNKMDVHNLATVFGPNILHKAKGGVEYEVETLERAEERKEVISVIEELICNWQDIFMLSAESYDTMLKALQKTNPESVDQLLRRRTALPLDYQSDICSGDDNESGLCSLSSEADSGYPSASPPTNSSQDSYTPTAYVQGTTTPTSPASRMNPFRTPTSLRARTAQSTPTSSNIRTGGSYMSTPLQDRKACLLPVSSPKKTPRAIMIPKVQVHPHSPVSRLSSAGILATPRTIRTTRFRRSQTCEQPSGLLTIPNIKPIRGSNSDMSSASSCYPSSRSTSHSPTSPDSGGCMLWSSDNSSHPSPERGHSPESGTSSTHRPLAVDSTRVLRQPFRRHSQDAFMTLPHHSLGHPAHLTPSPLSEVEPQSSTEDGANQLPQWQSERWKHWESITKKQSEESQEQQTLV